MDEFRKWAISVCGALIISAVLRFVIPQGSFKKVSSVVLSFIVLLTILSPLSNAKKDSDKLLREFNFFEDITVNDNTQVYKEAIKETIEASLQKNSIEFNNIDVDMNISEDKYIVINKIIVDIKDKSLSQKATELLCQDTGYDAQIFTVG